MTYSSSPYSSTPISADRPAGLTPPGQLIPAHGETTLKLKKSQVDALPFDFEKAVRDFIAAKEAHRFTGGAAPTADAPVEAAVRRVQYPIEAEKPDDFVADYQIEDDTPPPPTLEQRKQAMIAESRQAEQAAIEALMPAGKWRLLDMEFQRAMAVPEGDRSPEQVRVTEQRRDLDAAIDSIRYAAAKREADIEDITE